MMTSQSGVYGAEPAYPILAHSLLNKSAARVEDTSDVAPEAAQNPQWNLKDEWETGIQANNPGIFRCGSVIGFSRLRSRSKDADEFIGQIPRYLLTSHLVRNAPSAGSSAFIIQQSNFSALAPRALLNALQSTSLQPGLSKAEALQHLDTVQLLPVQTLSNAAQAIGKVSESLQELRETRQSERQYNASAAPCAPIVLIVVGLDTLAEEVIRASNPLRGTALLAATLRSLTRLARTYPSWLSIVLVNTSGLGPAHFEATRAVETHADQSRTPPDEESRPTGDDNIYSVFQTPGSSLLSTLLMRTLDQGIDTHLLLSDMKATIVAEVIKDRVGTGLGKWGIWSPKR